MISGWFNHLTVLMLFSVTIEWLKKKGWQIHNPLALKIGRKRFGESLICYAM